MRVHPAPRKRNITFRYDVNPAATAAAVLNRQKKLRRLPHIFSKVLELPFEADADVAIEENSEGFRFVAATDDLWGNVRAHAIEIHPGVMKVVVRDGGGVDLEEGLELDRWRFRLPPSTRPALATASYTGGVLVVTVPKGARLQGGVKKMRRKICRSCRNAAEALLEDGSENCNEDRKRRRCRDAAEALLESLVANEDFQHILRVLNTNVDGKQKIMFALTSIKGIGRRFANIVCKKADVDMNKRAGELSAAELENLMTVVANPRQFKIPDWFLNRKKDYKDGRYSQIVSNSLDMKLRDDLERLKKIRNHRGLRHFWGLRVRGQHTKTTGRRGKTVGVSKKR
ncbi:unnamed protein product [Musa banksii]